MTYLLQSNRRIIAHHHTLETGRPWPGTGRHLHNLIVKFRLLLEPMSVQASPRHMLISTRILRRMATTKECQIEVATEIPRVQLPTRTACNHSTEGNLLGAHINQTLGLLLRCTGCSRICLCSQCPNLATTYLLQFSY